MEARSEGGVEEALSPGPSAGSGSPSPLAVSAPPRSAVVFHTDHSFR